MVVEGADAAVETMSDDEVILQGAESKGSSEIGPPGSKRKWGNLPVAFQLPRFCVCVQHERTEMRDYW